MLFFVTIQALFSRRSQSRRDFIILTEEDIDEVIFEGYCNDEELCKASTVVGGKQGESE